MMNILGKTFYALFILLLVGVAGLFLATLLPIPGNVQVKIVKSGSMEPYIKTGSIVVVRPSATYYPDDVITFGKDTKDQIPTTHRILEKRVENGTTVYQTKGDANEEADPVAVPESVVIGKVLFHVPYAGYVLDFARQPWGFTFMIGIPAGIIILDELIRIVQEVAGVRRRKENGEKRMEGTAKGAARAKPAPEPVSEFQVPQRIAGDKPLNIRKRILDDVNTLDLSKVWGRKET